MMGEDLTVPLRGYIKSEDRKIALRIKISETQLKAEQKRLRGVGDKCDGDFMTLEVSHDTHSTIELGMGSRVFVKIPPAVYWVQNNSNQKN